MRDYVPVREARFKPGNAAVMSALRGVAFVVIGLLAGCAPTVTSIPDARNPTTIYLVDYGTHANLVLPRPKGGFAEFTYADWNYAVEGNRGVSGTLRALFWPSQGALGRKLWPASLTKRGLKANTASDRVVTYAVERESARELFRRLNTRFEEQRHAGVVRSTYRMAYVKDRESYSMFHTCNTEVAQWLGELGLK